MKKDIFCSECREIIKNKQFFYIDEEPVCYKCLFGDTESVSIYPIGFVKSNTPDKDAVITLHPHQQSFMYGLDEEKEICVVYYLHEIDSIVTVFNRGKKSNGKRVGVFASRTPRRTSRIGITDVKLLKISGLNLYVKGLDAFQGSPVLDIKATIKNINTFDNQEVIK